MASESLNNDIDARSLSRKGKETTETQRLTADDVSFCLYYQHCTGDYAGQGFVPLAVTGGGIIITIRATPAMVVNADSVATINSLRQGPLSHNFVIHTP
jgi:hypothetical protein